jgi:hypothetical protein
MLSLQDTKAREARQVAVDYFEKGRLRIGQAVQALEDLGFSNNGAHSYLARYGKQFRG